MESGFTPESRVWSLESLRSLESMSLESLRSLESLESGGHSGVWSIQTTIYIWESILRSLEAGGWIHSGV